VWNHVSFVDRAAWTCGDREFATLREVDEYDGPLSAVVRNPAAMFAEMEALAAELAAARPVLEAARKWRTWLADDPDIDAAERVLAAAVDALPVPAEEPTP
jgi:hypothetical protein